jgi:hypothetical protein
MTEANRSSFGLVPGQLRHRDPEKQGQGLQRPPKARLSHGANRTDTRAAIEPAATRCDSERSASRV